MKGTTRLFIAFMGSVGLALALGYLSGKGPIGHSPSRPLTPHTQITLTEANLVDQFVDARLSHRLDRVALRKSYLDVEIKEQGGGKNATGLFEDLLTLNKLAFERTDNVDRLLVRVVTQSPDAPEESLLLAMESTRERWKRELAGRDLRDEEAWHAMMNAFEVTVTPAWQNRFSR